ncbi:MAG: hypothetical protein KA118_18685 [Verrucomicrobia bacterium]|jgi:hypothetical protein|nr:hypothetical protein [Verrucomicrobiota bacterium]NLD89083.1 hypothetical protein [Lentisphaerota bacterium]HPC19605.1 hypothetical protein [Kiritimatiellia bacterium]HQN80251.1 hypothetical protein [Kiritimatiellia bacterium]
MNPESFFGPVSIIAILLAVFFLAMAYLRYTGVKNARTHKYPADAKPWQVANPYTAEDHLTEEPAPATLAPPPPADLHADSHLDAPVFHQFSSSSASTPNSDDKSGYVWE